MFNTSDFLFVTEGYKYEEAATFYEMSTDDEMWVTMKKILENWKFKINRRLMYIPSSD